MLISMLTPQANSMSTMTRVLESLSDARDNMMLARFRVNNAKAASMEISRIKQTTDMGVLTEEDGEAQL